MNHEEDCNRMTVEEREALERRWKTLATLVDLFEGATESSCYGPDRAEHLLREQSSADELRKLGIDESLIGRLFGAGQGIGSQREKQGERDADDSRYELSPRRRTGFSVRVEARFEAAHYLRSYRGITEPLHGHSYRVEAELERVGGDLDEDELAVDFVEARKQLESIASRLDYGCINEISPFDELNPTAENVARWFCDELQHSMEHAGAVVLEVRLFEGPVNSVTYRPPS
ncbi:MAG: 6-carboxytetrahydropterin synthase [Acidobacteria bacterium]|nr:6-carboxytetrahydropterin synthase [Acidobacteriota bacterium]